MITTNPYCELSDVKMMLGLKSTTDDAWITSLIPQAQAVIDGELGYSFQTDGTVAQPTTRIYSGTDLATLFTGWIQMIVQVQQVAYDITVSYDGYYNVQGQTTQDITTDCYVGPDNRFPGWQLERVSGLFFNKG